VNYLSELDSVPFPQAYIYVLPGLAVEEGATNDQSTMTNDQLLQIGPNPAFSFSRIAYSLIRSGRVKLEVYNLAGQLVRTLVVGQKSAGTHVASWDTRDELDREVPSGIYLLRLETDDLSTARKLVLLR
jgi:serine protease AprX